MPEVAVGYVTLTVLPLALYTSESQYHCGRQHAVLPEVVTIQKLSVDSKKSLSERYVIWLLSRAHCALIIARQWFVLVGLRWIWAEFEYYRSIWSLTEGSTGTHGMDVL